MTIQYLYYTTKKEKYILKLEDQLILLNIVVETCPFSESIKFENHLDLQDIICENKEHLKGFQVANFVTILTRIYYKKLQDTANKFKSKSEHDILKNDYLKLIEIKNIEFTDEPEEKDIQKIIENRKKFDKYVKENLVLLSVLEFIDQSVANL